MKTQTKKRPAPRPKNMAFISGKDRLGSLTNYVMGNNNTAPKADEGATELLWSDRHAYDVTFVSADGKQCKIRRCEAIRTDKNGISESQSYDYKPNLKAREQLLVYRNVAWRKVIEQIVYTDEFSKWIDENRKEWYDSKGYEALLDGETERMKVVEGKTKIKMSYPRMNIIFGVRREYEDPSF